MSKSALHKIMGHADDLGLVKLSDASSSDSGSGDKKPYGNVKYADAANSKYPIDTKEHAKAAWSYINMPKNQKGYSASELKSVMDNIKTACKKFGVDISSDDDSSDSGDDQQ